MRKKSLRVIAATLIVTNIFCEFTRVSYAAEAENIETSQGAFDNDDDYNDGAILGGDIEDTVEASLDGSDITEVTISSDAEIIGEIIEDRDEYSKSYLMSDNSKSIVMYSEPVHYVAEDGTYVEIDNSVIETEGGYENADNTYHVLFTDNEDSQGEVKFSEDNYEISWEYLDKSEDDQISESDLLSDSKIGNCEDQEEIIISLDDFDNVNPEPEDVNENDEDIDNESRLNVSVEDKEVLSEDEAMGHVINSSTVRFDGYKDGVGLEYEPTSTGVKENIILPDENAGNEFTFRLNLMGLKAKVTSANIVELYDEDTEEVKYYIPAPFMEDAKGRYSEAVEYSLSNVKPVEEILDDTDSIDISAEGDSQDVVIDDSSSDMSIDTETEDMIEIQMEESGSELDKQYHDYGSADISSEENEELTIITEVSDVEAASLESGATISDMAEVPTSEDSYIYLTITADKDWLESAAYPVTIDPIIKKAKDAISIDLGYVNSADVTGSVLKVGNADGKIYRSFVQFDLPEVEKGNIITNAELYLKGTEKASNSHYITARKITESWEYKNNDSRTIRSWATQPRYEEAVIDYAVNGGYFNITRVVKSWYTKGDNNGLAFIAYDEDEKKCDDLVLSEGSRKPYLKITYKNFIGLENYWGVHKLAVGTAGMGYINDYSGALTIVNTDVHTNGARMPFALQRVYNSNGVEENKWKFGYDQRIIIPIGLVDVKTYPYLYIDEDGTSHYFKAKTVNYLENGEGKTATGTAIVPAAADEDGLKLFIVPVTDKSLKDQYPLKLIDKSAGTVRYFDKAGNLAKISDSNQYENTKNSATNYENRIEIAHEVISEKIAIDRFEVALDAVGEIYDYTAASGHDMDEEYKAKVARARTLLEELFSDDYAKADYQTALKVQTAYESMKNLWEAAPSLAQTKTYSKAAKDALTAALSRVENYDLRKERISSVSDAVNNTAVITYDDNGNVDTITDPTFDPERNEGDGVNRYSYDGCGRLTNITFSNGKTAEYGYDENTGDLRLMQDDSGYKVEFKYLDGRIVEVKESAIDPKTKDRVDGQIYTISYNGNNTTDFHFSGVNDKYGDEDDIINTYVFDEKGRTVTEYSTHPDGNEVLGAQSYTYEDNAVTQRAAIDYDDQAPNDKPNLLQNYSFENGLNNWEIVKGNGDSVDIAKGSGYSSNNALLLDAKDEETLVVKQGADLSAGDYSLSFRVRAGKDLDRVGAVGYTEEGELLNIPFKAYADYDTWYRVSGTFNLKEDGHVNVYLISVGARTLFDCVRFVSGKDASDHSTTESGSAGASEGKTDNPNERNKIKDSAVTGRQTQNLLKNHSFEQKDEAWEKHVEGNTDVTKAIEIKNGNSYIGNNSAVFNMASVGKTNASLSQSFTIPKDGYYTASSYVKATGIKEGSARLKFITKDKTEYSDTVTENTPSQFAEGWDRLKATAKCYAGETVTVCLEAEGTGDAPKGIFSFDCVQLETGKLANEYNCLEDGSFELAEGNTAYTWKGLEKVDYSDEIINQGIDGSKCYHIVGEPGKDKFLATKLQLGGTTSSYVLSGWIRSNTTPVRKNRDLKVRVSNKDGSLLSAMEINDFSDGWKYFSLPMPAHQWREVSVEIRFFDNIGDLYIDGLQLSKNDVSTKRYDNNGNLTGVCVSERESTYTYDSYNRMKTMTTPGGIKQNYNYDNETNNIKSVISDFGPSSFMKYDEFGNQKSLSVHKPLEKDEDGNYTNTPLELYSENTYTDDGNYLKSSIDNNGREITYDYDSQSGLLLSEVRPEYGCGASFRKQTNKLYETLAQLAHFGKEDAEGILVKYEYDNDRISKVSQSFSGEERSISYTYGDFSDLKAITHNGFEYGYDYDAFGNVVATTVAQNEICKNEYEKNNGVLKATTYPDGSTVLPKYDNYGNVSEIKKTTSEVTDQTTDRYSYYNDGNLALHSDVLAGVNTEYDYNDKGKVCRTRVSGSVEGKDYSSRLQYIYNTMGKVQELYYVMAGGDSSKIKGYTYTYYKDGNNHENVLPDGSSKEYKYDQLRRLTKTTYSPLKKTASGRILSTSVEYAEKEPSKSCYKGTTNRVSRYVNKFGNNGYGYSYEYDDNGNIIGIGGRGYSQKGICLDSSGDREYAYDAFGEVIKARENYKNSDDMLYEYTYDDGGNITKETVYNIDKKTEKPHTYKYDAVWKDQLIQYDDKDITYDKSGNPENYLGAELKWNTINGTLKSFEGDKGEFKYTYLSDGQRLTKDAKGQKTVYFYNAGMLLAEENDEYRLNYYYDANGLATEIGFQKKQEGKLDDEHYYFFTRNGQGDIIGIYRNSDSKLIGNYEYDLWGNIVSVIPNEAISDTDKILERNPLRYRGYYYDDETGFYYLNARYYDPKVHRFISPEPNHKVGIYDKNAGINTYNLFAYCSNNPVNCCDNTGEFTILVTVICVGIFAATGMTIGGIIGNAVATNKGYTGWDKASCILTYAGLLGIIGTLAGALVAPLVMSATGIAGLSVTSTGVSIIAANSCCAEQTSCLALGLREYLFNFADNHGASTYLDFSKEISWKDGVMNAIYNPNMRILFNLEGIDNPMLSVQRAAAGIGSCTDWELYMIWNNPEVWERVTWFLNDVAVNNPFVR